MTYDDHHTFHETEQLDECKNLNASHFIVTKTSSSGLISPGNLLYLAVLLTMMKLHYVIRPKSTRVVVEVWWFPIQFTHSAYLANWASRKGKVNKLVSHVDIERLTSSRAPSTSKESPMCWHSVVAGVNDLTSLSSQTSMLNPPPLFSVGGICRFLDGIPSFGSGLWVAPISKFL